MRNLRRPQPRVPFPTQKKTRIRYEDARSARLEKNQLIAPLIKDNAISDGNRTHFQKVLTDALGVE